MVPYDVGPRSAVLYFLIWFLRAGAMAEVVTVPSGTRRGEASHEIDSVGGEAVFCAKDETLMAVHAGTRCARMRDPLGPVEPRPTWPITEQDLSVLFMPSGWVVLSADVCQTPFSLLLAIIIFKLVQWCLQKTVKLNRLLIEPLGHYPLGTYLIAMIVPVHFTQT